MQTSALLLACLHMFKHVYTCLLVVHRNDNPEQPILQY